MDRNKPVPLWRIMGHLRGLAIIAVVGSHSGYFAMLHYQHQVGSGRLGTDLAAFEHHSFFLGLLVLLQEFCRCAVPIFIFLTGHFLAQAPHTARAIWSRSRRLLSAYLVWSLLGWFSKALLEGVSPGEVLARVAGDPGALLLPLALGEAQMGFYFILVIVQFFVLARWAVPLMKRDPRAVLWAALALQLLSLAVNYHDMLLREPYLGQEYAVPGLLFTRWTLFFALGLHLGLRPERYKPLLARWRMLVLLGLAGALVLALESRFALHLFIEQDLREQRAHTILTPNVMAPMVDWKVGTNLWSLGVIFAVLALGRRWLPRARLLVDLGARAITIFLIHPQILLLLWALVLDTRWFRDLLLPWWLVLAGLGLCSLALPVFLARWVARLSPRAARYLTGS